MYKLLFLSLTLLTSILSYSQVRKTQATIVFINNDTLSAEIKDEQLKHIQVGVYYRQPGTNAFSKGLPEQIKSVKFADGRLFETVKTDSVSILLLCIIEGYYNLYAKSERNGLRTYYLRHEQDKPVHLLESFTDQYIPEEGVYQRLSNFEYKHQLRSAMEDNIKLTTKIDEMKFREDELVEMVKKYNEFKGHKYPEPSTLKKKSTIISKGILISGYPFITNFHAPGLGICFDFRRNRPYERFSLNTRVSFNIMDYKKDDKLSIIMEIPVALSYSYLEKSKLKLYFLAGITSILGNYSEISYGKRKKSTYGGAFLYLGTGMDYKIKKSALRLELSLFTKSFILGYIF